MWVPLYALDIKNGGMSYVVQCDLAEVHNFCLVIYEPIRALPNGAKTDDGKGMKMLSTSVQVSKQE